MITETNTKEIYDITGLTPLAGGYEFTFPYTSAKDIRVYTTGNRTDTEVSTSNYTIDKSGATPKVVFNSGYIFPEGQTKLTIIRSVSYSQELDLRNGDLIDADKLEGALDDITQQIQQIAEKVERAILSSVSDTEPLSIPEASQRNNMLLGFDSEGKAIPVLTTDIEQKLAQALAAEESAITAKNAAENAQHEAESAQSAAETAQGKAETAQAAAESAEASSQTLLASIKTKTEESIASINTAKTGAVGAVTTQQATSVAAVQAAQNTAESDIAGKRASALTAIDTAKNAAVEEINTQKEKSVAAADSEIVAKRDSALTDIQTARTNAVNAITTQKDQSLQEVEQLASERKAEINSLAANQKADVKQYTDGVVASAKTEIDTEKTKAVTAVQEEGDAEVTRVQSVYQADLDELKGDIIDYHYIEKDISGSVVIVDSNVINPVLSAKDNITVLHTGKNLVSVPYDDISGVSYNVTFTVSENGILNVNGTATGTAVHNFVKDNTANRRPIKAGTYTLSGCPAGGGYGIYMLTIGVTGVGEYIDYGDGITFTIPNDTTYYLKFKVYNGTTVDFDVKAQLEMSSGKTEWEQYEHENISVGSIPVSASLYQGINIFSADSDFNLSAKVKTKKIPIINLRDYVVGDGETDDTNAINKALIEATNGILYIPNGTYLFSKTLHVHSGTKVIGFGKNSVFKLSNNFELDAVSWRPDTYNAMYKYPMIALDEGSTGCELRNFSLIGQTTNWKDENEDGIMIQGSNHVIENLVINNINYSNDNFASRSCLCPAWGINIFKANTVSVRNCHIYDCGYENIGTEESENITISDCRFGDACQTSSQIHRYSKHIKFYGNSVYHTENIRSSNCPAFTCDASIGVDMDDIIVSNNTFGSHVNTVAGGENNIKIIGNHIDGIMYTNTTEYYGQGLMICNNHINGRINMRADNVIVSNNIINNDTEMPMARIYGNNVEMNGNLGIGIGKSTAIVEH